MGSWILLVAPWDNPRVPQWYIGIDKTVEWTTGMVE